VNGAIGAVQAGQAAQGNELMRELTGLVEAGMDVACFDLSQGLLEQHLEVADHLTQVSSIFCCSGFGLNNLGSCALCQSVAGLTGM